MVSIEEGTMDRYAVRVKKPDGTTSIFSNRFSSRKTAEEFVERSNKAWPGYSHEVLDTFKPNWRAK